MATRAAQRKGSAQGRIETLEINAIIREEGVKPREFTFDHLVAEYAADMKDGDVFPPVEVVRDINGACWLWDGYYRVAAALKNGRTTIACRVTLGDRRLAILLSASANAKHGERRTSVDKYFAVAKLLDDEEWSKWSSREIARQTHTSHPFVSKLRAERAEEAERAKSLSGNVTTEQQSVAVVTYRNRHGGISTTSATRPPATLRVVEMLQPEPTPSLFTAADQAQVDALIEQAFSATRAGLIDRSLATWAKEAAEKLLDLAARLRS